MQKFNVIFNVSRLGYAVALGVGGSRKKTLTHSNFIFQISAVYVGELVLSVLYSKYYILLMLFW